MTTIVMTGGTSGFGKITAARLTATPGTTLILGARNAVGDDNVLPLDLSRLAEVRGFAAAVQRRLGATPIDSLVLNAGLSFQTASNRTDDGFETTFAVNHLGHYLLLRLLLPQLAEGARVVFTSSGTHDPAEGTMIPVPRHANAKLLARPDLDPDSDKDATKAGGCAYSSSKLCNVLTARALRSQPEAVRKRLSVFAFDPGPTPGTGLARSSGPAIRVLWSMLGGPLGRLLPKLSTQKAAGNALADLVLRGRPPTSGEMYAKLRRGTLTWSSPSELAQSDNAAQALWHDSAGLVGLQQIQPVTENVHSA